MGGILSAVQHLGSAVGTTNESGAFQAQDGNWYVAAPGGGYTQVATPTGQYGANWFQQAGNTFNNFLNQNPVAAQIVANGVSTGNIPVGPGAGSGIGATSAPSATPGINIPTQGQIDAQNPIPAAPITPPPVVPLQGPTPSGATLDQPSGALQQGPTMMGMVTGTPPTFTNFNGTYPSPGPGSSNATSGTVPVYPANNSDLTVPQGYTKDASGVIIPATDGSAGAGNFDWSKLGVPVALGATGVTQAVLGNQAADAQAAAATTAATNEQNAQAAAVAEAKREFDLTRGDAQTALQTQQSNNAPYLQAGQNALKNIQAMPADNFTAADFQQDPGYAFRLSEGIKALQNSATATGLMTGNTLEGINNYAQGAASQEYQNAFNRYQTQYGTNLNTQQSIAGLGQTAVQGSNQGVQNSLATTSQAGQNYASAYGQGVTGAAQAYGQGQVGAAQANASGYVGAGNALTNALSSGINYGSQNALLNALILKNSGGNHAS